MPATRPNVQSFQEGSVLRALRGALKNPIAILTSLGALGVAYSQKAFRDQRMDGVKWKTRGETKMNPNWVGILADYHKGRKSINADRFRDAPVLIDGGALRRSISFKVVSRDQVEVGTDLAYGSHLHFGTPSQSPQITSGFQKWLYDLIKKARGGLARAADAPERRESREVRAAQKSDPVIARLEADVKRSKAAYSGQKMPKGERERLQRVAASIKARKAVVERTARSRSVSLTGDEAARYGKAQATADGMESLKWLLNTDLTGKTKTIKHPARPFVGVPPDMAKEAETVLGVIIARAS